MSTNDDSTGLSDTQTIAGDLSLWFCEQIWNGLGSVRLPCGEFSVADDEDMASLGYDEDDDNTVLVLRRESDGAFFEVDVEPYTRRVEPKPDAEAAS